MKTHSDKQNRTCSNCGEWVEPGTRHVPYLGGRCEVRALEAHSKTGRQERR